ncbi:MAG: hypothetical protein R2729_02530 [Bryobacteraceae bacterium]
MKPQDSTSEPVEGSAGVCARCGRTAEGFSWEGDPLCAYCGAIEGPKPPPKEPGVRDFSRAGMWLAAAVAAGLVVSMLVVWLVGFLFRFLRT